MSETPCDNGCAIVPCPTHGYNFIPKKPAAPEPAVLTRDDVEALIDREGSCEPWEYRLLAHDAALRVVINEQGREIAALRARLDAAEKALDRVNEEAMRVSEDESIDKGERRAWRALAHIAAAALAEIRRKV